MNLCRTKAGRKAGRALQVLLWSAVPPLFIHKVCSCDHDLYGNGDEEEGYQAWLVATDNWN